MRHIRYLPRCWAPWPGALALAALLWGMQTISADSLAPDPVGDLRQALKVPIRDAMNAEELKFRKENLERLTNDKVIRLSDEFNVDDRNGFLAELRELLGPGCLWNETVDIS